MRVVTTPRTPEPATEDTKAALLEAAERLFSERGVDATSVRAITRDAGANLASVHYHFGSKEELVQAVLSRRLGPLNQERVARLDACIEASDGAPPVAAVVRAFVAPAVEMVRSEPGGEAFARFVLRAFTDPAPKVRSAVREQFSQVVERFVGALANALPGLPVEEVHWRFHFMVGAMVHAVGLGFLVHRYSGGICDPLDVEAVSERLVSFVTGGLGQPPAGISGEER